MSDTKPISSLVDVTASQADIASGKLADASDVTTVMTDQNSRIADVNDALADNNSNRAGTSAPTDDTVEGQIWADTSTDPVVWKGDPDGSGADVDFVIATHTQELSNKSFATGGTDTHLPMGVIDKQFTNVGNVGSGEDDLMTYTLPGGTLDVDGKAVRITAQGSGNGTDTVTIKLHFGATSILVVSSATVTIWWLQVTIIRQGATDQTGLGVGGKTAGILSFVPQPTETLSGDIIIKVTGENTADTSNDAIVQEGMIVEILN